MRDEPRVEFHLHKAVVSTGQTHCEAPGICSCVCQGLCLLLWTAWEVTTDGGCGSAVWGLSYRKQQRARHWVILGYTEPCSYYKRQGFLWLARRPFAFSSACKTRERVYWESSHFHCLVWNLLTWVVRSLFCSSFLFILASLIDFGSFLFSFLIFG